MTMDEALRQLLEALESVGEEHEEIYDTDVRERMYDAVISVLIDPKDGYVFPTEFGMFTPEGNAAVQQVLVQFLPPLVTAASAAGLTTPRQRLLAFQNDEVVTSGEGNYYDDFFGYMNPEDTEW
jgi:hypothetical protein